jgi:hypothetical protein
MSHVYFRQKFTLVWRELFLDSMLQTVDKYRKDGEMLADARVTENGV